MMQMRCVEGVMKILKIPQTAFAAVYNEKSG